MQKSEEQIIEDFSKELIDLIMSQGNELAQATHWGEPSILLCDIVNIINNTAHTDYRRYSTYSSRLKSCECSPDNINPFCFICKEHWTKQKNMYTAKECLGTVEKGEIPCERFRSAIDREDSKK